MITTTSQWTEFYEKRINSGYQDYFNKRYEPLISLVLNSGAFTIREEGVGIGSLSKALLDKSIDEIYLYGFDLEVGMLELCRKNNPWMEVYRDDILDPGKTIKSTFYPIPDLAVTHGVIEHFEDHQIYQIFDRYERMKMKNIHYVPTDGYNSPSFGDERLLPYRYWLDKFKPKDYLLFNDKKDLLLINL